MPQRYSHTQIGWWILGGFTFALLVVSAIGEMNLRFFGSLSAVLALALVLFGTLTVRVDDENVRVRFGIGLIGFRIRLAQVVAVRAVRNRWIYGWGIRFIPNGMLYNVSGLDAVEFEMAGGRCIRVGTDEPHALLRVLTPLIPESGRADSVPMSGRAPVKAMLIASLVIGAVVTVVAASAVLDRGDPTVSVTADQFTSKGGWYSTSFARSSITSVELRPVLPRVQRRTNGSSAFGILRGHFRLDELGTGDLYINTKYSPVLVVRTATGFVAVNFEDPSRTRALYDQLR